MHAVPAPADAPAGAEVHPLAQHVITCKTRTASPWIWRLEAKRGYYYVIGVLRDTSNREAVMVL